jgi:hypothetical protein
MCAGSSMLGVTPGHKIQAPLEDTFKTGFVDGNFSSHLSSEIEFDRLPSQAISADP